MKRIATRQLFCFAIICMLSCHKQDCQTCYPTIFDKHYGGSKIDGFSELITTSDGGYIAVGWTLSNDGDVSGNHGREDMFVTKLYRNGTIQWRKTFGGS